MKFRAVIKKSGDWWIGWLIDIPGVNAQEKTKEELLESLKIGTEDMLTTDINLSTFPESRVEMIDVPIPVC
ncbi:MAG: type II toxin-antitoxin system HicB family antitoxin [bacterium]